ncbi:hypothetical protein BDQ12DRAFT_729112 [Crucibulum laeve]|uniref:Uncharacterized protein n=1 Tax=Crucibulum laeve TaxID=68775 RepID=A0A5C3LGK3_9AGAR|nr:hypothetical protein BDQ12DRAFT_729112 [Crucibulum laeve]
MAANVRASGVDSAARSHTSRLLAFDAKYDEPRRYSPKSMCHPGTRMDVLETISKWVNDKSSWYQIIWL